MNNGNNMWRGFEWVSQWNDAVNLTIIVRQTSTHTENIHISHQHQLLIIKCNVRKKWPMTWLEFVTWYGLCQIRGVFWTLCCLRKPGVVCVRLETALYNDKIITNIYLCLGHYVFALVCLTVSLSVIRITQRHKLSWKLLIINISISIMKYFFRKYLAIHVHSFIKELM